MNLYSPVISGSLTVTGSTSFIGNVTMTGTVSATASNATLLDGTGSVGFTTTGSFTTMSGSVSSRVSQIETVYATTGSNSFRATQSITGSLTVTGQIIAQTLNVQQVTSSIIYSSGSNVFGCDINSRQTFTGSFYQTGSVAYFGGNLGIGVTSCLTAKINLPACDYGEGLNFFPDVNAYNRTGIGKYMGELRSYIPSGDFYSWYSCGPTGNEIFRLSGNTGNACYSGTLSARSVTVGVDCSGVIVDVASRHGIMKYFNYSTGFVGSCCGTDNSTSTWLGRFAGSITAPTAVYQDLTMTNSGIATFRCQVCAPSFILANGNCITALRNTGGATIGVLGIAQGTDTLFVKGGTSGASAAIQFQDTGGTIATFYNNNLGLGIVAPSAKFHVYDGAAISRILVENSTSNSYALYQSSTANSSLWQLGTWNNNTYRLGISGVGDFITVESNGEVGIGTASPQSLLHVCRGDISLELGAEGNSCKIFFSVDHNAHYIRGTGYWVDIVGNENEIMRVWKGDTSIAVCEVIRVNGSGITCFKATVCAPCFATISDYRMKYDIEPITNGLGLIGQMKTYSFKLNYDCQTSFGMIAHELQEVLPEAVFGQKDGQTMQGVDYMKLLPITIRAIQEQQCTINTLKTCLGIA